MRAWSLARAFLPGGIGSLTTAVRAHLQLRLFEKLDTIELPPLIGAQTRGMNWVDAKTTKSFGQVQTTEKPDGG